MHVLPTGFFFCNFRWSNYVENKRYNVAIVWNTNISRKRGVDWLMILPTHTGIQLGMVANVENSLGFERVFHSGLVINKYNAVWRHTESWHMMEGSEHCHFLFMIVICLLPRPPKIRKKRPSERSEHVNGLIRISSEQLYDKAITNHTCRWI